MPRDERDESVIPDQLILDKRCLIDELPLDSDEYLDDSDDTLEEFDEPLDESDEHLGEVDKENGTHFLDINDDSFILFEMLSMKANFNIYLSLELLNSAFEHLLLALLSSSICYYSYIPIVSVTLL